MGPGHAEDIDEVRDLHGDKYDSHIKNMVDSLKNNRKFQDILTKRVGR
ncbi:hypothetical protein [Streptomyces alanosinicus]|nr:hypothetical protein [Streptomyces alanosinicus]